MWLISLAIAAAVFLDARRRMPQGRAAAWAAAALLVAGLAAPVYLLLRPSPAQTWGLAEILALTVFFAMAIPLLAALFHAPAGGLPPLPVIVALALLQNAVFVGASLYVAAVKYRLPAASLGLARGRWAPRLGEGAAAAAAALLGNAAGQTATVLVLAAWMGSRAAADLVMHQEVAAPIYRILPRLHQDLQVAALAAVVGIVVPIGEEVFFRGLTYGALRRRLNRHLAVLVSALFFAAAHLQPVAFLPLVVLGGILAYTYDYTGSLVPGMIAHGVNNLAALFVFYQHPQP